MTSEYVPTRAELLSPAERPRDYPAQRIVGLDVARALAVFGMFGAHVGAGCRRRRMVAFQLAGCGQRPGRPSCSPSSRACRWRCCPGGPSRSGATTWAAPGHASSSVRHGSSRSAVRWRRSAPTSTSSSASTRSSSSSPCRFCGGGLGSCSSQQAALAVLAPASDLLLSQFVGAHRRLPDAPFVSLAVTGAYPALIWWTFILVGLAVGRCDLGAAEATDAAGDRGCRPGRARLRRRLADHAVVGGRTAVAGPSPRRRGGRRLESRLVERCGSTQRHHLGDRRLHRGRARRDRRVPWSSPVGCPR